MSPQELRAGAHTLRNVRVAQADGGTWAQIAPLLGCTDARTAKARARALERALRPVATAMTVRKGWDAREVPDEGHRNCAPLIEAMAASPE